MTSMTAIKLIHYSTYHLVTTSHRVHLLPLPNSLTWAGSFHSTPAIFSSSKYLYSRVGHIFSNTFKFILVMLVKTQKANSVLLIPFCHQKLEVLEWFMVV